MLHACEEALQIIADYEPPAAPAIEVPPRAAVGCACTEAPRGILFHRYRIDGDGVILEANIVPPTSQNQRSIENDLRKFVEQSIDLPTDKLTRQLRARHPQLRSVHLLRDTLSETQHRKKLTS